MMIRGALLLIATSAPDLVMPIIMFSEMHEDEGNEDAQKGGWT